MRSSYLNVVLFGAVGCLADVLLTFEAPGVTRTTQDLKEIGAFSFPKDLKKTDFTFESPGNVVKVSNAQLVVGDYWGGTPTETYARVNDGKTMTMQLKDQADYFGFYFSAIDSGNILRFYNKGGMVYALNLKDLARELITDTGSSEYMNKSQFPAKNPLYQPDQLYVFVNFNFLTKTFDKVTFDQRSDHVGNFEISCPTIGLRKDLEEVIIPPVDTETTVAPVDTETTVAPVDTETTVAPVDTETTVAPVDTETTVAPVDPETTVAPVDPDTPVDPIVPVDPDTPINPEPTDEENSAPIGIIVGSAAGGLAVLAAGGVFWYLKATGSSYLPQRTFALEDVEQQPHAKDGESQSVINEDVWV